MKVASDAKICAPVIGHKILFASKTYVLNQERGKRSKINALIGSSSSNLIASQVFPVLLDAGWQIVNNTPGRCVGIVAVLASPCVIEPRNCPRLANFRQSHYYIFLKHHCDFKSGSVKKMMCNALELLIDLRFVEILQEYIRFSRDGWISTIDRNVTIRLINFMNTGIQI